MPEELQETWPNQIENNNMWCKISSFIIQPALKMTISTVAIIGLERFFTLKFCFNNTIITNKRVLSAVGISWVIVAALTVYEVTRDHVTVYMKSAYQCIPSYRWGSDVKTMMYINITYNTIGFLVIMFVNTYTLFLLFRMNRYVESVGRTEQAAEKQKRIVTITVLLVSCLNTFTWLPLYIVGLLRYTSSGMFQHMTDKELFALRTAVWWIVYLSPALNPILYALRLRVIRKEIKTQISRAFSVNGVSLFCKKNKIHMMGEEGRKTDMVDMKQSAVSR